MALTGSSDINRYAIDKYGKQFGENGSFRLVSKEEMRDENNNPREGLFSHTDDFTTPLTSVSKKYPSVQEVDLNETTDALSKHSRARQSRTKTLSRYFMKDTEGELTIISSDNNQDRTVGEDWKLDVPWESQ